MFVLPVPDLEEWSEDDGTGLGLFGSTANVANM